MDKVGSWAWERGWARRWGIIFSEMGGRGSPRREPQERGACRSWGWGVGR